MVDDEKTDDLDDPQATSPEDKKPLVRAVRCGTPIFGKWRDKEPLPYTGITREFFPPLDPKDKE